MNASEGLRIISVAKALEAFQRGDPNISQYFGVTLLAGRAGLFLSSLRGHRKMKWKKFRALAAAAHIDAPVFKLSILPWLKSGAFIEGNPVDDASDISCNVLDHEAVLSATSQLFRSLDPTPEEVAVLGIVDLGAQLPQLKSEVLSATELGSEEVIERATGLAKGYKIVNVLEGPGVAEPVIYSPLIWGDKISKAGKALSHLKPDRREVLLKLVELIRSYQGMPVVSAVNWVTKQGQPDLVDFAVGVGLLDKTQIAAGDSQFREFLTTPHIYGEFAATQGKDVCDRIRLFLDSIRHGEHYGDWYTGRIGDPTKLLSKLVDTGEIGPCTAFGRDYQLVEKAGVVNVKPSRFKPGQFIMELVQEDTVRLVRDIVAQKSSAANRDIRSLRRLQPKRLCLRRGTRALNLANNPNVCGRPNRKCFANSVRCKRHMSKKNSIETGVALEARIQRLFICQGAFAERGLLLRPAKATANLVTDVDVVAHDYSINFHHTRIYAECKGGRNVSTLDRVVWVRGMMSVLGAERGYLVVDHCNPESSTFATAHRVEILQHAGLQALENALRISSGFWPGRANFFVYEPIDKAVSREADGKSTGLQSWIQEASEIWREASALSFSYGRLNNLLSQVEQLGAILKTEAPPPENAAIYAYAVGSLLVRLSHTSCLRQPTHSE